MIHRLFCASLKYSHSECWELKKWLLKQGASFQHIRLADKLVNYHTINCMIIPSLDIGQNVN